MKKENNNNNTPEIIFLIIMVFLGLVFVIWIFTSPVFLMSLLEAVFSVFRGSPPENTLSIVLYGLIIFLISIYVAKLIIKFVEKIDNND
ncbi:hypothetical protein [Candidatus Pelagibacter sp.]|uniref:hypothetical protein n=1 Tax=Candidatus Pelagibacter sp. TaxID=2024849 RepID=UPI003F87A5C1